MDEKIEAGQDQVWHPVFARQSEKLTAKARKFGVKLPSLPQTNNCTEDWTLSQYTGEWFLSNETQPRLKLAIRTEKRQRDDELRKWATAIFAGLAFVLGVAGCLDDLGESLSGGNFLCNCVRPRRQAVRS